MNILTQKELKFKTKRGRLTHYAFTCGYIEKYDKDRDNTVSLSHEGCVYQIKGFLNGKHFWDSIADSIVGNKGGLTEARKTFDNYKKQIKEN